MIFEKKKIKIEILSEYLTEVRGASGLSVEEAIKKTAIKPQFFKALESGEYKILPADVYVFGFLKQLADLYAINHLILIEQYKKEKAISQQLAKEVVLRQSFGQNYFSKVVITPKVLSLFLSGIFVVLTLGYIIWQVWSINRVPSLQILQPADNAAISGSFILVQGKTEPGISVSINDQPVFVDSQGNFQSQLGMSPGPKEIFIKAANRFGKSAGRTINVTGEAAASTGPEQTDVVLKADFTANVTLGYIIDGQAQQTLSFSGGDSKIFSARQKIVLSTSDAGATRITLNGQALGPMGRSREVLNNVPFFAQSADSSTASSTAK